MSTGNDTPTTTEEWLARHRRLSGYERVGYLGLGEQYNAWLYRLRRRQFLRLARGAGLTRESVVLDVGCGTCFYIDRYRELGLQHVTGVDLSPDAIAHATAAYPDYRFAVCDVTTGLPPARERPGGYDWVSAMDVLFHIIDDHAFRVAVEHCGRAVGPGGTLVVTDHFPGRQHPADHTQSYHTLAEYEEILEPLGLRRVALWPVFVISNGQVGDGGLAYAVTRTGWRWFATALRRSLRLWRPLGEACGALSGIVLTTTDDLLRCQPWWLGYSTKVALFRRV